MNGAAITTTDHTGTVSVPTGHRHRLAQPAVHRARAASSADRRAPSVGLERTCRRCTYHTNIRTQATGAKRLDLPLATPGRAADRPDPAAGGALEREHGQPAPCTTSATSRRPACGSCCRIALADLTGLPTVTAGGAGGARRQLERRHRWGAAGRVRHRRRPPRVGPSDRRAAAASPPVRPWPGRRRRSHWPAARCPTGCGSPTPLAA